MPTKKRISSGEKLPLILTAAERKLVLEGPLCLARHHEEVVRETPDGKPVMMSLDDLDDFSGYIAAEANNCKDKKKRKKLDAVFQKIQTLLDEQTDKEQSLERTIAEAYSQPS